MGGARWCRGAERDVLAGGVSGDVEVLLAPYKSSLCYLLSESRRQLVIVLYASTQKAKSVFLWSVASSCNFFSVKEEFTIKLISLVRIAGTSERTCVILQSEQKTTVKSLCQQFCFQQEKDLGMSLRYGPTALRRWMEGEGFASGRQRRGETGEW